jgi:hypothetical protein
MQLAEKIAALFAALKPADLDAMPPAEHRRFAEACCGWADQAERGRRVKCRNSGVLANPRNWRGHD